MRTEMRRFILEQLRLGATYAEILDMLRSLSEELEIASVYIKATQDADMRP